MPRRARATISVVIVALLLLQATPSIPSIAASRVASGRCEIAATEETVDLAAVPADRSGSPLESSGCERTTLGGFTIVPVVSAATDPTAVRHRADDLRRRTGATWVRALQQRARSPGDPEPH